MADWKAIEGTAGIRKDYGNGRFAIVSTEAADWCGERVHSWQVWAELWGGRLDGTNYPMGQTVVYEGKAADIDEAIAACDGHAGK